MQRIIDVMIHLQIQTHRSVSIKALEEIGDVVALPSPYADLLKHVHAYTSPFSPVEDVSTPHGPPINWYALGDSYTAGPGTGENYDEDKGCARNVGSYAVQLKRGFPFNVTDSFDFIACSGYTSADSLIQARDVIEPERADFMVITLGGNDIGFSSIAAECLVKAEFLPGDCDVTLAKAKGLLAATEFETNIHAHRFFNDATEWCNDKTFAIRNPKLTRTLRGKMNNLADALNKRLEEVAANYIRRQHGKASWSLASCLITINPDKLTDEDGKTYGLFDGHRFCEPGITDLKDPSVWFFSTFSHDSLQKREGTRPNRLAAPEILTQTFHPRTAGFKAIKRVLQESLQKNRPAER
ncbi:MAG: hypothetical protein LQ349_000929 [Xanthoria aureola]|nr:MAG: hypothetical protein LQ349_000929 [Xanthoria aureola]